MLQILMIVAAALILALYVGAIIAPRSGCSDTKGGPGQWSCDVLRRAMVNSAIL
ncbi:MAG TPA: hypothetical protein VLI93_15815 [Acetobacteraceae bacterium]|nr:hypothetical protein [Acetobacteraceae bacterium]